MRETTLSGDSDNVPRTKSQKTILFADDSEDFRRPVAAYLSKCGYCVITASDGIDALAKAREFVGIIHLVLSDIKMPRMTGIELASLLNQERPDTKILLISGFDFGLLVQSQGWQFLRKPFVFDTLRDRIRDFLAETTGNDRARR
jgi:DNA-binding response OmpR family regulator